MRLRFTTQRLSIVCVVVLYPMNLRQALAPNVPHTRRTKRETDRTNRMHYLIDGYNVTRSDPATRDLSLEDQRDRLERRLRADKAKFLGNATYTIVWDGHGGAGVARSTSQATSRSEYTRLPTADDAIVEKVRGAKERIGIVTSDHELASRCRDIAQHGVDVLKAEQLFEGAKPQKRPGRKAPMRRDIGIPSNANEINRELKEIWGIEE